MNNGLFTRELIRDQAHIDKVGGQFVINSSLDMDAAQVIEHMVGAMLQHQLPAIPAVESHIQAKSTTSAGSHSG